MFFYLLTVTHPEVAQVRQPCNRCSNSMDATGSQVLTAVIRVLRADGGLLETFFFKKVSKHTTQTQNSTIYLFYGDNSKIDLKFIKTDLLKL